MIVVLATLGGLIGLTLWFVIPFTLELRAGKKKEKEANKRVKKL